MLITPQGARPAARVILIDLSDRILYLHGQEKRTGRKFWVMPGGGVNKGETYKNAAVRELREETGMTLEVGPCVWTRHHIYCWEAREHNQFEAFFIAKAISTDINPTDEDDYIFGHRWWSLDELRKSNEQFAPTNIASLLAPILSGEIPKEPFDCGI